LLFFLQLGLHLAISFLLSLDLSFLGCLTLFFFFACSGFFCILLVLLLLDLLGFTLDIGFLDSLFQSLALLFFSLLLFKQLFTGVFTCLLQS